MGKTYGLPSDEWSTGITFVEVEQGRPPFQIENEFELIRNIFKTFGWSAMQSARKWGETYGGEFQALVDSMLVVDPDDRISSCVAARRSLSWWCCSQPLAGSGQPSSASQHTQPLAGPPLAGSVQPAAYRPHRHHGRLVASSWMPAPSHGSRPSESRPLAAQLERKPAVGGTATRRTESHLRALRRPHSTPSKAVLPTNRADKVFAYTMEGCKVGLVGFMQQDLGFPATFGVGAAL